MNNGDLLTIFYILFIFAPLPKKRTWHKLFSKEKPTSTYIHNLSFFPYGDGIGIQSVVTRNRYPLPWSCGEPYSSHEYPNWRQKELNTQDKISFPRPLQTWNKLFSNPSVKSVFSKARPISTSGLVKDCFWLCDVISTVWRWYFTIVTPVCNSKLVSSFFDLINERRRCWSCALNGEKAKY